MRAPQLCGADRHCVREVYIIYLSTNIASGCEPKNRYEDTILCLIKKTLPWYIRRR